MAEIRNAPFYFIIRLKNWKIKNPKRTLFTDANLITDNIEKQGKQVVIALLDMFTPREDASVIDTICKKAVVRFQENKGVLSSLRTPGGGRYPHAKFL